MASFNIIFSIFFVVIIGYVCIRQKWISNSSLPDFKFVLLNIAIPCMLFVNITQADIGKIDILQLWSAYYSSLIIIYCCYFAISIYWIKNTFAESAIGSFASVFSNNLFVAYPLIVMTWGVNSTVSLFVILFIHAAVLWTVTSVLISIGNNKNSKLFTVIRKALIDSAKQPVVMAIILALLYRLSGLNMPGAIVAGLDVTQKMAMPLALFVLGTELSSFKLKGNIKHALVMVLFKNLLFPLLMFTMAYYVFQLDLQNVKIVTIMAASPMGIFVYVIASRYDTYVRRAASAFLISNSIAPITLIITILLLGML